MPFLSSTNSASTTLKARRATPKLNSEALGSRVLPSSLKLAHASMPFSSLASPFAGARPALTLEAISWLRKFEDAFQAQRLVFSLPDSGEDPEAPSGTFNIRGGNKWLTQLH